MSYEYEPSPDQPRASTRIDERASTFGSGGACWGKLLVCRHCGAKCRDNETGPVDCPACGRPVVEWVREDAA